MFRAKPIRSPGSRAKPADERAVDATAFHRRVNKNQNREERGINILAAIAAGRMGLINIFTRGNGLRGKVENAEGIAVFAPQIEAEKNEKDRGGSAAKSRNGIGARATGRPA